MEAELKIDHHCQKKAYLLRRNFKDADDFCQVLFGEQSILDYAEELELENRIVPFICIMALSLAQELPPSKWHARAMDFILRSGAEMYSQLEENFAKIDEFHIKFIQNEYIVRLETIFDTFFGRDMLGTFHGHKTVQSYFENELFASSNFGMLLTPGYVVAVFFYKNLFYLYEPYPCNSDGTNNDEEEGSACLQRFMYLENLVFRCV